MNVVFSPIITEKLKMLMLRYKIKPLRLLSALQVAENLRF